MNTNSNIEKKFRRCLFIFRRDLRLKDNSGLILASKYSETVFPAFFFDERQVDSKTNPFYSSNCVQFMAESLKDIDNELLKQNSKLLITQGNLIKNLETLIIEGKIDAIFVNMDYSPFSTKRDLEIEDLCKKYQVAFNTTEDLLLTSLHACKSENGNFPKVFSHYHELAKQVMIREINDENIENFAKQDDSIYNLGIKYESVEDLFQVLGIEHNPLVEIKGGRTTGEILIDNLKNFENYKNTRSYPVVESTRLSAHLKFGCLSAREVYWFIKNNFNISHTLIKQLHWRDFYMKMAHFNSYMIGSSLKPKFSKIVWEAQDSHVEAWKRGMTGVPIVDSAMRCLNATGYMHNRLRMVVGSYLVKDILADWKIGEQYFANKLVDYDVCLNNGNWQWVASTGADARPFVRVLNPTNQSEKFDEDCAFVYKWLPELKSVIPEHIHKWDIFWKNYENKIDYPKPILCHKEQKEKVMELYKKYDMDNEKFPKKNSEISFVGIKRRADKKNIKNTFKTLESCFNNSVNSSKTTSAKTVTSQDNKTQTKISRPKLQLDIMSAFNLK